MSRVDPAGPPLPGDAAVRERIGKFLAGHNTLALATVGEDGAPAAAAVFYAHDATFNLYFLSEERTVHGRNLAASPKAAGTIQADGQDWRAIQGLQLHGTAVLVPPNEFAHAASVYARKFAFVAALLAGSGAASGPAALTGPVARARFYVLRPDWLRLVDNTVRFGYKEELRLAGESW
jgi:uncharacterized protein